MMLEVLPRSKVIVKSKLTLLDAWQAKKSRDKMLEQGIVTLFRKPDDWEDGGLVSQRTIFSHLEFNLLLY